MDLRPRQVIRALQMGQYQKAVNAKSPWICAVCMACSARCPQEIDIHGLMLAIRRTAKRSGLRPLREADVFDDCFVANIRTWGKSNEAILAAKYNVASGHLAQDALNAPRMAVRKMIGLKIHKVKDRAAVRSLVDRVLKREG
jgi:heterodisulfide reductase subunit C